MIDHSNIFSICRVELMVTLLQNKVTLPVMRTLSFGSSTCKRNSICGEPEKRENYMRINQTEGHSVAKRKQFWCLSRQVSMKLCCYDRPLHPFQYLSSWFNGWRVKTGNLMAFLNLPKVQNSNFQSFDIQLKSFSQNICANFLSFSADFNSCRACKNRKLYKVQSNWGSLYCRKKTVLIVVLYCTYMQPYVHRTCMYVCI